MKKLTKDITKFGMGSVVVGASATAVAPFGAPYTSGITSVGQMMPVVGSLMMTKNIVRMTGKMTKPKKRRR